MLRLIRLRRPSAAGAAISPGGQRGGRGEAGSHFEGGSNGKLPGGTAVGRPSRARRAQCMLLLHTAWVAFLFLTVAASVQHRRGRHLQLARELLAAGGMQAGGTAGGSTLPGGPATVQSCAEALQLPQVALMFLVKGPMHHESLWREWFKAAAGQLPAQEVAAALCGHGGPEDDEDGGNPNGSGSSGAAAGAAQQRMGPRQQLLQACTVSSIRPGEHREGAPPPSVDTPSAGSGPGPQGRAGRRQAASLADASRGGPSKAVGSAGAAGATSAASEVPSGGAILRQQALFDVYVHPHPSFPGYPPGSLFHGRELPAAERVVTEWGQHSLVDAARALLRAAHRNPRVRKFVLLSESDLPLYSPQLLYDQLLGERLSRMNACNTTRGWRLFEHRWVDRMETKAVKGWHWRKSWQWFALTRPHVELVLADRQVDATLRAHCRTMYEPERKKSRECYSDEHYIPMLLAVAGRDNETDCQGWLTDTDWARVKKASPHPWEYQPGEVSDMLLLRLRRPELPDCGHAVTAAATAAGGFVSTADLADAAAGSQPELGGAGQQGAGVAVEGVCRQLRQLVWSHLEHHRPLGPQCRLLARKFPSSTAEAALAATVPCDSLALVTNPGVCPGETMQQAAARRRRRAAWERIAPTLLACTGMALVPLVTALVLGSVAALSSQLRPASSARQGLACSS